MCMNVSTTTNTFQIVTRREGSGKRLVDGLVDGLVDDQIGRRPW